MKEESPSFYPPEVPIQKRSSGGPLIFVLIFALALIFGLIGVLAARVWDPLWNPFRPNPEKVMDRMMEAMEKVKTLQEKGEINMAGSFSVSPQEERKFEFKLSVESKEDISQPEKPKIDSNFDLSVSLIAKEALGAKFALSGEAKRIGDESYLKLTTIPAIPFLEMFGIDLSQFKDNWVKFDENSVLNFQKKLIEGKLPPEVEKIYKEQMEREKMVEKELQEKIKAKLKGKKFYLIKKELPDEEIGGIKVYHYLVSLNNEEVFGLISEILKEIEGTMLKGKGMSPTFNEEEFRKKVREFFEKIGEVEGEVWIGKKDYLLYKYRGEKSIDLSKFVEKGMVSIGLSFEKSKFNQPVKIEVPARYKTLEEVLAPLLEGYGKFFGATISNTRDDKIIADLKEVGRIGKLLYTHDRNSYKNLCQSYTLNKNHPRYGKDLAILEGRIKESQGGVLNLSCYSAAQSFCVIVDLVSPERGKYCLDSSGKSAEVSQNLSCVGKGTAADPYRCPQ